MVSRRLGSRYRGSSTPVRNSGEPSPRMTPTIPATSEWRKEKARSEKRKAKSEKRFRFSAECCLHNICVPQRSCRCNTPSRRPASSITGREVIFFCSMMFERGDGEDIRADDFGRARHALAGGEIHHMFAVMLQQAAQVAIADEADELLAIHDGVMPRPLRDIS